MYLKTANAAGGEVLGEFTSGVQYTDIPIVIDTRNTSRDIYNSSSMNFVGLTTAQNISVPNGGNASANCPLIIGSTYYTLGSTKYLRLTVKTYKPGTGFGISQCKIKGIDYRRFT